MALTLRSLRNRKALTAAAQRIDIQDLTRVLRATQAPNDWQRLAWDFFDEIGELRFAAGWVANAASRVRLFAATVDDSGDSEPTSIDDQAVQDVVADIYGGPNKHPEMLSRMATHLFIVGETFLTVWDDAKTGKRMWLAASRDEFSNQGGSVLLRVSPYEAVPLDPETSSVMRIWRPHPRRSWEADSPVRALRTELAKLRALSGCVLAQADSRMAGAGILVVPESATLAPMPGTQADPDSDPFVSGLTRAMVQPLSDRDAASSVVPIVVRVPDKAAKLFDHITTATPFDAQVPTLTDQTLRKLAIGLDIPPEILLGLGDVNHWSADQISTEAITLHIAPVVELITSGLSDQYLQPVLEAAGRDASGTVVWYDYSELVDKPNRGPEALALYDKGLVNEDCVRRENGFGDGDKPNQSERLDSLLWNIARSPIAAPVVLPLLGFPAPKELQWPGAPTVPPVEHPQDDPLQDTSDPGSVPDTKPTNLKPAASRPALPPSRAGSDGMLVAADVQIRNVLAQCGKRLLSREHRGQYPDVPADQLHTVITVDAARALELTNGAFEALRASGAPNWLAEASRTYAVMILKGGVPHSTELLYAALHMAAENREDGT